MPAAKATGSLSGVRYSDSSVSITVADSGTGMGAEALASARLPYFTTKTKGTGLGLPIVERAVNEMSGTLTVASVPGEGTTFTITLPQAQEDA